MSKIIAYVQSHDDIFKRVKQESAIYAKRKKDAKGEELFDQLVFDEEYLILFRQLFFDARAKIISAVSAYLHESDDWPYLSQNFATEKNLILTLNHPDTFKGIMKDSISNEMKEFIVAYIMCRWLETKVPQDADMYLGRANVHLSDMKRFLEMRTKPLQIRGIWF